MRGEKIKFETIVAAKAGDGAAMEKIVRHFRPLINKLSRETGIDVYGRPYEVINEDVRSQLEAKLITAFILHYDLSRTPDE